VRFDTARMVEQHVALFEELARQPRVA
jgi:hypothetical protein